VRVAVLAGGRSSEHEISLASAEAVRAGLGEAGHDPVVVKISRSGEWSCDGTPVAVTPGEGLLGAGVVFPVLHGPFGEDGTVQGLLEIADVPYVGAGVLASAACLDKLTFKALMAHAGLPQVQYRAVRAEQGPAEREAAAAELGLPVFVKPARLGSSVGISKVSSSDELAPALGSALEHDPLVIVEAMAEGLEVECSVIGNSRLEVSEPGQIVLGGADWYDFEAKYQPGGMELVVPAPIPPATRERVRELAMQAYRSVGCAGMARVDFFITDRDGVLVNELNTIPGFTATSVFAKLFEASGIPYPVLLDRLVGYALERYAEERSFRF
jgi:D-alanine-D-alanine ligase